MEKLMQKSEYIYGLRSYKSINIGSFSEMYSFEITPFFSKIYHGVSNFHNLSIIGFTHKYRFLEDSEPILPLKYYCRYKRFSLLD